MKTQEELQHEADKQKRSDEINAGVLLLEWPDDVARYSGDGGEGISDFYRSLESRDERVNTQEGQATRWLIYSIEHRAWWASNRMGYTKSREMAGRYSFEDAHQITENANRYLGSDCPNETMCPEWGGLSPEYDEVERNRREDEKERIEKEFYENERSRAATADYEFEIEEEE